VVGNVLWLVLGGVWLSFGYLVAGVIQCITIIGIPFGVQSFKLARRSSTDHGRTSLASCRCSGGSLQPS